MDFEEIRNFLLMETPGTNFKNPIRYTKINLKIPSNQDKIMHK